jgi:hypothetical protein
MSVTQRYASSRSRVHESQRAILVADWPTGRLADWPTGRLADWPTGRRTGRCCPGRVPPYLGIVRSDAMDEERVGTPSLGAMWGHPRDGRGRTASGGAPLGGGLLAGERTRGTRISGWRRSPRTICVPCTRRSVPIDRLSGCTTRPVRPVNGSPGSWVRWPQRARSRRTRSSRVSSRRSVGTVAHSPTPRCARGWPRRSAPYRCGRAVLEQVGQRSREDGDGDVVREAGRRQQPGPRAQGTDPVLDTGGSGAVQDEQDARESG